MGRPVSGLRTTCRALSFREDRVTIQEVKDVRQTFLAGNGSYGSQPVYRWVTWACEEGVLESLKPRVESLGLRPWEPLRHGHVSAHERFWGQYWQPQGGRPSPRF